MKTTCNPISKAMQLASISLFSVFLSASVCHSAAPVQIGNATVTGTLTGASGSTFNLSLATVALPADVSRLGSDISLASEVSGILPVANGGTGTGTASTQTANTVFSGPTTGAAAAPAFRALVAADIPSLDAGKISTGLLPVANGGSGTATPALVAGSNVTITGTWPNQTIATSLSGSVGDLLTTLLNIEVSVTTTATLTLSKMHVCSGTAANYTVTLPAASGNAGKLIGIRMASALTKLVTLAGNAAELIDGENTRVMWSNESAILLCDGTGWSKIAGRSIPMRARARRAASYTFSATSAVAKSVPVDTSEIDNTGLAYNASGYLTIQRTGSYALSGGLQRNNTTVLNAMQIFKGSVSQANIAVAQYFAADAYSIASAVTVAVSATSGDNIYVGTYDAPSAAILTTSPTNYIEFCESPSW